MYYIALKNRKNYNKFEYFMDAFKYQQEHYPDRKILYSNGKLVELVWDPEWEKITTDDLDKQIQKGVYGKF